MGEKKNAYTVLSGGGLKETDHLEDLPVRWEYRAYTKEWCGFKSE
jgi:hypothetical protein